MDRLKDELILSIFNYVSIDDLIFNCKLTCKKWNLICNRIKFRTLIIKNDYGSNCWYYWYRPINLEDVIYSSKLCFLDDPIFKNHFIELKYLKINLQKNEFKLEQLNEYVRLEHLEIDNDIKLKEPACLQLPNLQLIKISFRNNKLKINSTKLKIINVNQSQFCEIVNKDTVEFIEVEYFNESLEHFSSLKIFKCDSISLEDYDLLLNLPSSLEQIHFYFYENLENYMAEIVTPILTHRLILKNLENVSVYFRGIKLVNNKSITDYGFEEENDLRLVIENFDQIKGTLPWITKINYDELIDEPENLANEPLFFYKFNNIQEIEISRAIDQNQFLCFIKNFSNLISLKLKNTSFNHHFYNKLPCLCALLERFQLIEKKEVKIDFEFILKLFLIQKVKINRFLSIDLAMKIITKSKFVKEIEFELNENLVYLKKMNKSTFQIESANKKWKNLEPKQLLNLFKTIESNDKEIESHSNKRTKLI